MSSFGDSSSSMNYIDLDSFNPEDPKCVINSPRSLEAIEAIGVDMDQQYLKPSSYFIAKYGKTIGLERAKRYESRRLDYMNEAISCRVALISIDSAVVSEKKSSGEDGSSEYKRESKHKAPERPRALNVTFGNTAAPANEEGNTEYSCESLRRKPQNYGDTEILVNPIAREERRVLQLAQNEKKIERARIRKSLEEELQMMRSMAMREEEEARKKAVDMDNYKFNRRRQANAQKALTLKEEKENALLLLKKGAISPFEVQDYMKSHETLQSDRYARATQLFLQKEASQIVKDSEMKKEDMRRKQLIHQRQEERVRHLREQREKKTAAIQQAQVHQMRESIVREKDGEEKRKKGDDAFHRAKVRNEIIQRYFQETMDERQTKANDNRIKVDSEREDKQQKDHARELQRESEIEKRRLQQQRDVEIARSNRSDKQNIREEVYVRAELIQNHKERTMTKRMQQAEVRSKELMQRKQEEQRIKQQRHQMMMDEQREHIQRVERMQEYKRNKTSERLQFEEERVKWLKSERERLRSNVKRSVTQNVYGGDKKSVPEHIEAAARAVAVKFQISEAESVSIAEDMFHQIQQEDGKEYNGVSARPSSAYIAFNPSLTSKRSFGNTQRNALPVRAKSSRGGRVKENKKEAGNVDDYLLQPHTEGNKNPMLYDETGVTAKQRTDQSWEDVDEQRQTYRRVYNPTSTSTTNANNNNNIQYSGEFRKRDNNNNNHTTTNSDYFDTYSRHTLHDPKDANAFAKSGQKKILSLQAKHSSQLLHMIEQEHQAELKRQGLLVQAPPGNVARLEALFASERAQSAAKIQGEQRRQRLEEASLAEAQGLEVPHGK